MIITIDTDKEFQDDVSPYNRLHGTLKAIRRLLRVPEGEDILYYTSTLMRRIDDKNWNLIEKVYCRDKQHKS